MYTNISMDYLAI